MKYRALVVIFFVFGVALQYQLWFGEGWLAEVSRLQQKIDEQQQLNAKLTERNAVLIAQVKDLKGGLNTIESLARLELGMVKSGETFFQIIE